MRAIKRLQYNSPVILTYSLLALAVTLLTRNARVGQLLFCVYRTGFADMLFYLRLFTHTLGHANMAHYFGNFMLILVLGPVMEEKYGSRQLLLMMAITSVVTGLVFVLISPAGSALLGASGIVFMLILLSSFVNLKNGCVPLTLILVIIVYIGNEIAAGAAANDGISHLTHIIGGICGAGLGIWFNRGRLGRERAAGGKEAKGETRI
ncbi:MAG: rhomboid family intramembrane serine protease [Firmicutes bacterium]|nr:rhomboid family intramembrane serine protease [Bacillota bacterium]